MPKSPYSDTRLWALALLDAGLMTVPEIIRVSGISDGQLEVWARTSNINGQINRLEYCQKLWAMKKHPREVKVKEEHRLVRAWKKIQKRRKKKYSKKSIRPVDTLKNS